MRTFKAILTTTILMAALQSAYARTPAGPPVAQTDRSPAYRIPDPGHVIRQGARQIQAFLATDAATDPVEAGQFLETNVAPLFDFLAMSHAVLGPLNDYLSRQQHQQLTAVIKKLFLTALATNLADYRGGKVSYLNFADNPARNRAVVRLAVYLPDEYPTMIELRLARTPDGWKIIDVAANGISAVAHYRHYVRSVAQRSGLDSLLK